LGRGLKIWAGGRKLSLRKVNLGRLRRVGIKGLRQGNLGRDFNFNSFKFLGPIFLTQLI